jgi:hypothetical protein
MSSGVRFLPFKGLSALEPQPMEAREMHRKTLFAIAALALMAVLGLSSQASAATVKGTVVHANKSAHTFVVASRTGRLTKVSSRRSARAGSVVKVTGRKLKSGSLKAKRLRVGGHKRHARLHGLVTWASAKGFTVASRGASLLVHRSSSDDPAPLGAPVNTDVTIDDQGDLNEDNCHKVGDVPGQLKLEGVVLSTDTAAQTITISGDDDEGDDSAQASDDGGDQGDQNDQGDDDQGDDVSPQIVVHVPDASAFTVGQKVELIVTGPAADGSFTLVSVDQEDNGDNSGDHSGPGSDDSGSGDSHGGSGDGSDG